MLRLTMTQLWGIDEYLTLLDTGKMPALQRSWLSALHSGAFIDNFEHARYDGNKQQQCALCECPDTRAHWIQCPRYALHRSRIDDWPADLGDLPDCALNHLLVPRLEQAVRFREALWNTEDRTKLFSRSQPPKVLNHLFLDGTCTNPEHKPLALAAWAVISAAMASEIAFGPLPGVLQTIARAELTALIAALRWMMHHQVDACFWSDSLTTVRTVNKLMHLHYVSDGLHNRDLWIEVWELLQQQGHLILWVRWIPSHLHAGHADNAFEDWAIEWNSKVDCLADVANRNRSAPFWSSFNEYKEQLDWWTARLRPLRQFYFSIAEDGPQQSPVQEVIDLDSDELGLTPSVDTWDPVVELFEHQLPVNWQIQCEATKIRTTPEFLINLINWWCETESMGDQVQVLSEVEFVFALFLTPSFKFPFQQGIAWVLRELADLFQRPTFSQLLKTVQFALQDISKIFPQLAFGRNPKPDHEIGLYKPFKGISLCIHADFHSRIRQRVQSFTASRPVRKSRDLARPA